MIARVIHWSIANRFLVLVAAAALAIAGVIAVTRTPLDALPDWLFGFGFIDDLAVLAWVMRTWQVELEAFQQWRTAQSPEVLRVVERLPEVDESITVTEGSLQ